MILHQSAREADTGLEATGFKGDPGFRVAEMVSGTVLASDVWLISTSCGTIVFSLR